MPCMFKKNINKLVCDNMQNVGTFQTCSEMNKHACDRTPVCCTWKMSGWDITWIVLVSLAGAFCLIVISIYLWRKVYLK